jgi:hypothetical protein
LKRLVWVYPNKYAQMVLLYCVIVPNEAVALRASVKGGARTQSQRVLSCLELTSGAFERTDEARESFIYNNPNDSLNCHQAPH